MKPVCLLALLPAFALSAAVQAQTAQPARDTLYVYNLPPHDVEADRKFASDTARYRFNQLRYYVKTVMPYVNAATVLFKEIDSKLAEPGLSRADRKRFISSKETEMRDRFENQIRSLNTTQGMLLIKLIARQTGLNIHKILQETKGSLSAAKYGTWARLHGINLSKKYNPEDEPELERVMRNLGY